MKTSHRIATVILGLFVSAVAFADFPQTFPNSSRDAGAKPATRRSGSASIEAWALLNKDGKTDIEITTGHLGSAGAPGNIDKAQLKFRNGSSTATRNHNNLNEGGYVALHYEGLSTLDSIQIQTNVSGIDPKRTDVVTVDTDVKRRPDLAVSALHVQATTRPGDPVAIEATIHELNGELGVGATADCVLFADGIQVDQSPGIELDPGETDTCALSTTFSTVGTVNLRVSLLNVFPGDWDTSNNSITGQIVVVSPSTPFRLYDATLSEGTFTQILETWTATRYEKKESRSWGNFTMFTGEVGLMNIDLMTAAIHYETDGVVIADFGFDARTNLPPQIIGGTPCRTTRIEGFWIQVCEQRVASVRTGTFIKANRNAGLATFHSEGWDKNMAGQNGEPYFTWNQTDPPKPVGSQIRTGSSSRMRIQVEDGQIRYEQALQFVITQLPRFEFSGFSPQQCSTNVYASTTCTRSYLLSEGIRGTASGRN